MTLSLGPVGVDARKAVADGFPLKNVTFGLGRDERRLRGLSWVQLNT